jgi:hypothetical protein
MNKLKVLGASLAMALLVASPAAADTDDNGNFGVENQFFGTDTVQFGGGAGNDFDNDDIFDGDDFDNDDVFDDDDFDDDVFDD